MDDLKKDPQTRSIPVHIMSSFAMRKESLLKGAIDFVTKSEAFENMDGIFSRIEQVLNKSPKKVLIIEDNSRHARALAYFLGNHDHKRILREIADTVHMFDDAAFRRVKLGLGLLLTAPGLPTRSEFGPGQAPGIPRRDPQNAPLIRGNPPRTTG